MANKWYKSLLLNLFKSRIYRIEVSSIERIFQSISEVYFRTSEEVSCFALTVPHLFFIFGFLTLLSLII